ncbi:MAG: hypothetical protein K0V04_22035 [Deltaproteobacteria bacterium]|nr:hypothetical protein [Deltaproteobacteria bacterium]
MIDLSYLNYSMLLGGARMLGRVVVTSRVTSWARALNDAVQATRPAARFELRQLDLCDRRCAASQRLVEQRSPG